MKILVLGAGGMAGHTVSLYFHERGHDVTAFSRKKLPYCNAFIGDIFDSVVLERVLLYNEYDFVINCVGILNQQASNAPAQAVFLNSYLPHFIADTIKNLPTKLIHMSTDCVFSGKHGGYLEGSLKDGETFYDRTKALGEVDDNKNLTFRNSIVGPDLNEAGIGLFNWFMKQSTTIYGYTNAIWTGVTTLTLAKAMECATSVNLCGVYNLVNNQTISKFNLCRLFNHYFKNDSIEILPNDDISLDKSLICSRKDFSFVVPSYEEMIQEMYDWVLTHQNLYSHYFKGVQHG